MLKAAKPRHAYKTDSGWLDAIYRKNKSYIDSNMNERWKEIYGSSKRAFKALIKEQMVTVNPKTGRKYTINQAIKRVENSKDLHKDWSSSDVSANNFKELFKKDKKMGKKFREETRKNGKYTAFDPKKLKWEGWFEEKNKSVAVYKYDEDVYIIERNSPDVSTGASIEVLSRWEFESREGKSIFFKEKSRRKNR